MSEDSDKAPLDWHPQEPFSDEERRRLRKLLIDDDRATWARKQVRIFVPWLVAVTGALYAFAEWLRPHWK